MSTVKISQLPVLTSLSANNANTLFVAVNLDTDTTGQFSTTTLAQVLFANNVLNVGTPSPDVFPGLLAQFVANTTPYGQVNFQNINANGTMDLVITADTGTDTTNYIDLGIQNSTAYDSVNASAYYPLDGYLYVQGLANTKGGNLIVGTASSNTHIKFVVGGSNNANTVARFYSNGAAEFNGTVITRSSQGITFSDGSQQGVAAAPANYTQSAFNLANTVNAGLIANVAIISGVDAGQNSAISIIQGVDLGQNTLITSVQANTIYTQGVDATQNSWISSNNSLNSGINSSQNTSIGLAWNLANTSLQNTSTITVANNLIVPGNTTFGNVTVNGTATFTGNTTRNGNITTNGNSIINGTLTNNGNTFNNGITYNNSITYLQGQLLPNVSNISIGSPTQPFQNIYLSNSAVVFSNANVSITGTLFANGTSDFYGPVLFQNQNATPSNGAIEIVASTGFATVSPSANGTMIHVTGFDNTSTKIIQDNFGSGGTYTLFNGRSGRGTAASPSASQAGDILVRFGGNGYGTTGFGIGSGGAYEQYVAAENFTDSNKGTNIVFGTTPTGSNVVSTVMTVDGANTTINNNLFCSTAIR